MKKVKFRIAAYTDAAGKVNPKAPRNGNEDNMYVRADLGRSANDYLFIADQEEPLSDKGCLIVVADGMGGMNAGEVASEIAINVVKESFSDDAIPQSVFEGTRSRTSFMESVIVNADSAIKAHAKSNPECEGMGSTIIMVWLYKGQATISWCGDSRAYLFRENEGLKQISKDHSYVQGLVDEGKITQEEAFDHPYGNIITRSLGDPNGKAKPDSITIPVYKDDIILVNSDGLSGVLRDSELESVIRNNRQDMNSCRQALWKAAEAADWHDNVTAILCEITDGETYDPADAKTSADTSGKSFLNFRIRKSTFCVSLIVLAGIAVWAATAVVLRNTHNDKLQPEQTEEELLQDIEPIPDMKDSAEEVPAKTILENSSKSDKSGKEIKSEDDTTCTDHDETQPPAAINSIKKKTRLTPADDKAILSRPDSIGDNPDSADSSIIKKSHLIPNAQVPITRETTVESAETRI